MLPKLEVWWKARCIPGPNTIPHPEAISTGSQGGQDATLTSPVCFSVAPIDPSHVFPCPFSFARLGSSPELIILTQTHPVLVLTAPVPCSWSLLISCYAFFSLELSSRPKDRIMVPDFYIQATCLFPKQKSPCLPWVPSPMTSYPPKFVD